MIDKFDSPTGKLDTTNSIDIADNLLEIGCAFDYFTPILNWLQGYNTATVKGVGFDEAYIEQMRLQELGIKSRIEGNLGSYRVVVSG